MNSLDDLKAMLGDYIPKFSVSEGIVTASKQCSVTKEQYTVQVPLAQYEAWRKGALIQRAMPQLSAGQREFFLSGNTPAEFDSIFAGDE